MKMPQDEAKMFERNFLSRRGLGVKRYRARSGRLELGNDGLFELFVVHGYVVPDLFEFVGEGEIRAGATH